MIHDAPTSGLAEKLKSVAPKVKFDVRVDTSTDRKYQKDEIKRLKGAAAALEKEIKDFNSEKVAGKALRALKSELASKKARLLEYEDA